MIKNIFLILLLTIAVQLKSQSLVKKLDFIIVVNDGFEPFSSMSLEAIDTNNFERVITIDYYPGNLEMSWSDFNDLMSPKTKTITLILYSTEGKDAKTFQYQIGIKPKWFEDRYNILKIYNLENKKYRKRLNPLSKDKNYTFELESPSHTFYRIK